MTAREIEVLRLVAAGRTNHAIAQHETEHTAPVEAWDAYDQYVTAGESDLAQAGLRLAGLRPGDAFLDVAAGTGGLSLPAARLGARVLATDWSPTMAELFAARAAAEGFAAEARVMDCHALDLPEDAFDVTGSQFGVVLVPDQARALREMVRVTLPGGRVLLIAYGDPALFEALHVFVAAAQVVVPDVMRERLWDWTLGGNPIPSMLVADLSEAHRSDIVRVLDGMVRERADRTGTAVFTAPLNIGVGTVTPPAAVG